MYKKVIIVVILAVAIIGVVMLKNRDRVTPVTENATISTPPAATAAAPVKSLPKLLDLGAGKCIPCKMMTPILDQMEKEFAGQLEVEFIDVWKDESAGKKYGIRMIPTQILFDADGKELFRHEGFFAREDILKKWSEFGIELKSEK
jgi:thioredoxin 1